MELFVILYVYFKLLDIYLKYFILIICCDTFWSCETFFTNLKYNGKRDLINI